jgi:hypothetical protein
MPTRLPLQAKPWDLPGPYMVACPQYPSRFRAFQLKFGAATNVGFD